MVGTSNSISQFKDIFFDRDKVSRAVDRALKSRLNRFGGAVRKRDQFSMKPAPKVNVATGLITRKRKGLKLRDAVSTPGDPPYSHAAKLLRKHTYYGYEAERKTVVIGPALLAKPSRIKSSETGPQLTEFGGTATQTTRSGRSRSVHYEARPHTHPAFEAEKPKFLDSLKDSVR